MKTRITLPWTKRANAEARLRVNAELKLQQVRADWVPIRRHRRAVQREIELNDWTATAKRIFAGEG